ncbi:AP-1 complex subunit sigma-2 [Camelus dromedarius]|uniref:AP-1 complex subunit sigma-2 n=1 Tax=Camelus dromedarius TaxID=9838 RepID=A0A5N4C2N7_CAMDR|nr:AP-1 complex subunit sigma-2 [Camelus dromedarius]
MKKILDEKNRVYNKAHILEIVGLRVKQLITNKDNNKPQTNIRNIINELKLRGSYLKNLEDICVLYRKREKQHLESEDKEKKKITRELVQTVLARKPKMCSFLEWRDLKIVYKRYASLYFCCAIEDQDNELITLEIIHRYVELLDKYFGSVCELDIIFNFEKAYFILDEFLLGGEVQETSKKNVLKAIEQADLLQESQNEEWGGLSEDIL